MATEDLKRLFNQYFDGTILPYDKDYLFSKIDQNPEVRTQFTQMETSIRWFVNSIQKQTALVDTGTLIHQLTEHIEQNKPMKPLHQLNTRLDQINEPKLVLKIQWGFVSFIVLFFSVMGYIFVHTPPTTLGSSIINFPNENPEEDITISIEPSNFKIVDKNEKEILNVTPDQALIASPDQPIAIDFQGAKDLSKNSQAKPTQGITNSSYEQPEITYKPDEEIAISDR